MDRVSGKFKGSFGGGEGVEEVFEEIITTQGFFTKGNPSFTTVTEHLSDF